VLIGDMQLVGEPPLPLIKACSVIALAMHQAYDQSPWLQHGKSKTSCVLSALTVRDFLRRAGWKAAQVAPAYLLVRAFDAAGNDVWSVGVGDHHAVQRELLPLGGQLSGRRLPENDDFNWSGHLVVKAGGYIIDPTLYQCARPAWPELPGMMATPLDPPDEPALFGMQPLACMSGEREDGFRILTAWLDQPWNTGWKDAPDTELRRRLPVVQHLTRLWKSRAA
jgi:hypothetical protein